MGKAACRVAWRTASLSVLLAVAVAAGAAQAQAVTIHEIHAGLVGTGTPNHIAAGPEGDLWLTGHNEASIDRVTPQGALTEFFLTPNASPEGITLGPNGQLWFSEPGWDRIGSISPAGSLTEFASNGITGQTAGITEGSEGDLWFTQNDGTVGRITPLGFVTQFSAGITQMDLRGITLGAEGNLWFTEESKIGRITPSGEVTEFSEGITPGSEPRDIVLGPDGNLWFTERAGNRIGRITPAGVVSEFSEGITPGSEPLEIAAGPDGNLWFTERAGARIGRITSAGVVSEFSEGITPGSEPSGITAGPQDSMWFTERSGTIGQVAIEQPVIELPKPPTVVTGTATSVTYSSSMLHATVNPNGSTVGDCHFEYGTSESYGSSVPCASLPGGASGPVAVRASLPGLSEHTLYHVRIVAANAGGTSYGGDQTFTTGSAPAPPASGMWVGLNAGGWGGDEKSDVANVVNYVRIAGSGREVPEWANFGVKVDYDIEGSYNAGGFKALNPVEWVANALATVLAHPEIAAVEVGNEVYGEWFWGADAESQENATAYANVLKLLHTAFVAAFGSARPLILASDTDTQGSRWNEEVFAKGGALEAVDGVVIHPYGEANVERSQSALGNRAQVERVYAADKKPVYVTEVGWPTCVVAGCATHTGDSLEWTQPEQATNIYNFIDWARGTGYIRAVMIYGYRDFGPISNGDEYGIEESEQSGGVEGKHKLAYTALQEAAREQRCTVCS